MKTVRGQPAWVVDNGEIEMTVTRLGAQMAPVVFDKQGEPFQPYYISPWQEEETTAISPPLLVPLRGDFFCLPFGGGAGHPAHGESSGSAWTLEDISPDGISLSLEPRACPGRIVRHLSLVKGHPAVYSRTVICGVTGPMPFAHHAILPLPERDRLLLVSTSPFRVGFADPDLTRDTPHGECQSLLPGARFQELAEVPGRFADSPVVDCSAFPARAGYCDIMQTVEDGNGARPSWVAAVNTEDHWLWFAFKNPRIMPGRVFWMENNGRREHPWNGRNRCLGIEDGCMYFDKGLTVSAGPNPIRDLGIATTMEFTGAPVEIRYVQGAVRVPEDFDRVASVDFPPDHAVFTDGSGHEAIMAVCWEFALSQNNQREPN